VWYHLSYSTPDKISHFDVERNSWLTCPIVTLRLHNRRIHTITTLTPSYGAGTTTSSVPRLTVTDAPGALIEYKQNNTQITQSKLSAHTNKCYEPTLIMLLHCLRFDDYERSRHPGVHRYTQSPGLRTSRSCWSGREPSFCGHCELCIQPE
jgi:hypothetical protein